MPSETSPDTSLLVVIVVNFNGGAMLLNCLESLRRQTWQHFVAVVVDNASTDDSADRAAERFPEFRVIRSSKNLGFAAGNNVVLRELGSARWVALLNPDAIAREDWLERLIAAAEASPCYAMFGSRMVADVAGDVLDGVGDAYHVSGLPWRIGHGQRADGRYGSPKEIFAPCAAAALYRREVIEATRGFDEDFFCYLEDVDLGFRARLTGYRALYVPDAVVIHEGSGIVGRHSDFQLYHGHRNLVWTFVRNMPGPLLAVYLPLHLLLTLATLLVFTSRGRSGVIWRAKRDAVLGLPRAIAKRRTTQAGRVVSSTALRSVMERGVPHLGARRRAD
jgi:GT2 family glycosyltransferase